MPSEVPADPYAVAAEVASRVLAAPPTLGTGRLVCVDGPAGSGKTTVAAALADVVPDAHVVHCDELLEGWPSLQETPEWRLVSEEAAAPEVPEVIAR